MFNFVAVKLYDYFGKKKHAGRKFEDFYIQDLNEFCVELCDTLPDMKLGMVDVDGDGIPRVFRKNATILCKAARWWPNTVREGAGSLVISIAPDVWNANWRDVLKLDPNPYRFDCFLYQELNSEEKFVRLATCGHEHLATYTQVASELSERKLRDAGWVKDKQGEYFALAQPGLVCGVKLKTQV